jgi:hypothetical protein
VTTFAAMNLYTAVDPVFLLQAQVILNNIGFFSVRLYNVQGGSVVSFFIDEAGFRLVFRR